MPGIAEELFVDSEKLPIRLNCSICLDIAEAAVITACDHVFCTECIAELQAANGQNCECPNCREPVLPITPAMNARNFLSQQLVFCSDIDALRCGWQGKYSMWHTHTAKYCPRASQSDKTAARNARVCELGQYSKQELCTMSVGRMKKILQEYLTLNIDKLSASEKEQHFNYKKFLEKGEYVDAILLFQNTYGLAAKYSERNPAAAAAAFAENISSAHAAAAENSHAFESHKSCSSAPSTSFPTTYNGLKRLKIRQLSQYLRANNIDPQSPQYSCIEKKDLIELVLQTQQRLRDILDGHCYDPNMERANFSPPLRPTFPAHASANANANSNLQQEFEGKEELKLDAEDDMPAPSSSTAYQINAAQLRQNSTNRIDINASQAAHINRDMQNPSTAYSHVYGDHQHATYVNRDHLANSAAADAHDQCMYSSPPYNHNHNHAHDHAHPHSLHTNSNQRNHHHNQHHHHNYAPMSTTTSITTSMHMPQMPRMPHLPAMPNMFNDAMHNINNAANNASHVFNQAFEFQ